MLEMRKDIDSLPTKKQRDEYSAKWGMDLDPLSIVLSTIALARNLIQSVPPKVGHSELQGLIRMLYNLLLDSVLIPKGSKDYAKTLRTFPFLSS